MSEIIRVEVDRQRSSGWAFPAYEAVDNVKDISIRVGRNSEREEFGTGTANLTIEVDRDSTDFVTSEEPEADYVNGFSRACLDYLGTADESLTNFESTWLTYLGPVGTGKLEFTIPEDNSGGEWRLGPDDEYYAPVEPYKSYVVSFAFQETTSFNVAIPLTGKVHWFTESGGFISSDNFHNGLVSTPTTEQRLHGTVTAPAKASYVSIGAEIYDVLASDTNVRFSKFMIHKYDEAYELANGTALKPFATDDLFDKPIDATTPVRVALPGNQFKISDYPTNTIGSDTDLRDLFYLDVAPPIYKMEGFTNTAEVGTFMFDNRITTSLVTTDAASGTKCVRAQTELGGSGTWGLYFTPSTGTFNVPVEPGKKYNFSVAMKNKGASTATFSFVVRDTRVTATTILSGATISAGSSWIYYSASWTAPVNVYSAHFIVTFAASGYDIYFDEFEVQPIDDGVEHERDFNYASRLGDFESTSTVTLKTTTSVSASSINLRYMNDNTAGAPSGTHFVSLDKVTGITSVSWILGITNDVYPIWVEAGKTYRFSIKAKKTVAAAAQLQLAYRFNNTLPGTSFTAGAIQSITSDWAEYHWDIVAPSTASGINISLRVQGLSTDAVQVYVDDYTFSRIPVQEISSTVDEATLERTAIYRAEPRDDGLIWLSYGNDQTNDPAKIFKWQHSGRTRTRYKATITYAGYDLPVGTTVYLVPIGTNGRGVNIDEGVDSQGFNGIVAWDQAQVLTMPDTPGETLEVEMLAPDVPWRAWTFAYVFDFPIQVVEFGYTFSDEYIGPDGYEDEPGEYENVRFTGKVAKRDDDYHGMAIDDLRLYTTSLECIDMWGVLTRASLMTPYQAMVLKHKPIAYFPLNSDGITELGGRLLTEPEFYTRGTPSNWGASYDSEVTLAGLSGDEGGSYEFVPSGNAQSGQLIRIADPVLQPNPGRGFSFEAWFKHSAAISAGQKEVVFAQIDSKTNSINGAYFALTDVGFDAGIGGEIDDVSYMPTLDSDDVVHHFVITYDGISMYWYLDNERYAIMLGGDLSATDTYIGGMWKDGTFQRMFNGHIGHVAIYDYQLSDAQIEQHWKSGKVLRSGEDELTRIEHILNLADQPGIPPVVRTRNGDISEPVATLYAPSWRADTTPSELLNDIAKWTGGQVFAGQDGQIIYENKYQRLNNGGESNQHWLIGVGQPIQPEVDEGLKGGPDLTKIINEAVIDNSSPEEDAKVIKRSINRKSIREYGKYGYQDTFQLADSDQALYTAQWLVNTNDKPYARYEQLVFRSNANAETADFCRSVRISDYIYGSLGLANGIAGGELKAFVESISEEITIDGETVQWETYIELSPANNQQVWVLGDPVYGELGAYRLSY